MLNFFLETPSCVPEDVQLKKLAAELRVKLKYSDAGEDDELGTACEFGQCMTIGVGPNKKVRFYLNIKTYFDYRKPWTFLLLSVITYHCYNM